MVSVGARGTPDACFSRVGTPVSTLLSRLEIAGLAAEWAETEERSLAVAWATCPRGDWLLDIVAHLELDRRAIVRAASDCVLLALPHAAAEPAARAAWEIARRWIDRQANGAECWAAGAAARQLAETLGSSAPRTAAALSAAAALAFACDDRAEAAFWAQRAYVAECAAHAAAANAQGSAAAARRTADLVREHFPFESVAKPIALASRTPRSSGFHSFPVAADAAPEGRDSDRTAFDR